MNAAAPRARLAFALVACVVGCQGPPEGDGLEREAVSGTVNLDGQPLSKASLLFLPAGPGAIETSAEIHEGKFDLSQERGPVAGSYKVAISSQFETEVEAGGMPGDPTPPKRRDPIPAKYNTKTTLTAEVKKGGPNALEFDLKSK